MIGAPESRPITPEAPAVEPGPRRRGPGWWIGLVARIAIGVGIVAYLLTFIPASQVLAALKGASRSWILLGLLVLAAVRYLSAIRTRILSDHLDMSLSTRQHVEISLAATFYGLLLPGEVAGGAVRWYRMSRPEGMRAQAAAVVTLDKLIATIMVVVVGLLFWFIERSHLASRILDVAVLCLLLGLLVTLSIMLSRTATKILLAPVAAIARRFGLQGLYRRFEKVTEALWSFRQLPARMGTTITVVTAVRQLLAVVMLYCFARALAIDVEFVTIGWVHAFMNIGVLLPVSISGLGVREGMLVYLLRPYGVPGSEALALSVLMLGSHLLLAATGGLLEARNVMLGGKPPRDQPGERVAEESR